jgi:hypothetical protein
MASKVLMVLGYETYTKLAKTSQLNLKILKQVNGNIE